MRGCSRDGLVRILAVRGKSYEIINVARTEAYARNMGAPWFRPVYKPDAIWLALGHQEYRTPLQDNDVPWTDPDDPDTYDFYGVYPLDISGADDSTRASTVIEYALEGGTGGRIRHATRQIVFSVLLLGRTEEACEAGMRWLRNVLLGGPCENVQLPGADLCYFSSEPCISSSREGTVACADDQTRTYANVIVTTGPTVSAKQILADGGCVWTVDFTAVAGNPFQYGVPRFPTTYDWFTSDDPDNPPVKNETNEGFSVRTQENCSSTPYVPVNDPNCPQLIVPPGPPSVRLNCFDLPAKWARYRKKIPANIVPLWSDLAPVITITASRQRVDTLRFRFYIDPQDGSNPTADSCSYCAEFVVTYMAKGSALDIDTMRRQVTYRTSGQTVRAEHLLSTSSGGPFNWPLLTCGTAYVVLVDSLQSQKMPYVEFSLVPRSA